LTIALHQGRPNLSAVAEGHYVRKGPHPPVSE